MKLNIPSVKECIEGTVKFQFYRSGDLYYKCQNGFIFTVPVSDTHDAVFKDEDRGIFFMRWIRKNIELLKWDEEIERRNALENKN